MLDHIAFQRRFCSPVYGARCAPYRRCGCVAHRPLHCARVAPPATGGGPSLRRNHRVAVVWMGPVAVPGIFVGVGAPSSSADRGHSLGSLNLPSGSGRLVPPTSYARQTHNPEIVWILLHNQRKHPSRWMGVFFGCGGRTRTYDLRVMSPTSFQLLYSAI